MARAAHAVVLDDRVWVFDPFDADGAEERVRALGEPVGVVQTFARHARDCAAWASRLGAELHVLPRELPASGWEVVSVPVVPTQFEVAFWAPAVKTLVCGDILAAGPGYKAPHERVGVHPFFRLKPPRGLGELDVEHLLMGHGEGVHGPAAREAIRIALDGARRGTPQWLAGWVGSLARGRTPR